MKAMLRRAMHNSVQQRSALDRTAGHAARRRAPLTYQLHLHLSEGGDAHCWCSAKQRCFWLQNTIPSMSTGSGRSAAMKAVVAAACLCLVAIVPAQGVRSIRGGEFDELIQLLPLGSRDVTPIISDGQPELESPVARGSGESQAEPKGTKWALLIAGSSGYGNYRHQVTHGAQYLVIGNSRAS